MARAWTWPFSSAASVSLTSRWRSTRDLPANSGDITSTRKWLSPVPGELWWPACTCDSLITSSRVGRSAIISFSRIVAAIDIQEAVPSEIGAPRTRQWRLHIDCLTRCRLPCYSAPPDAGLFFGRHYAEHHCFALHTAPSIPGCSKPWVRVCRERRSSLCGASLLCIPLHPFLAA